VTGDPPAAVVSVSGATWSPSEQQAMLGALQGAAHAGGIALVETQVVDRRASYASSAGSPEMGSWSGTQSFPTGHADVHIQSEAAGAALPGTSRMTGAHHTYGTCSSMYCLSDTNILSPFRQGLLCPCCLFQ